MGTRNSTIVKLGGEIKVAQYGQWDGYPTGQGQTVADFLASADLDKFKEKLAGVKEIDQKKVDRFLKKIGCENGWLNMDQSAQYNKKFPGLSRDHGADILGLIYSGKVKEIHLDPDFRNDSLFCEYWYEIDLDAKTVTMNGKTYTFDEWVKPGFMEELEKAEDEDQA